MAVSTEISIAGSKDIASTFKSASGHLQRVGSRQESTNISRKIRWSLHDKKVVDELVNNIRSFNDSLLDLVPVGESIRKPQTGDSSTTFSRDGGPTTWSDIDEESGVTGSLYSSVARRLPLRLESASCTISDSQRDAYKTSGTPSSSSVASRKRVLSASDDPRKLSCSFDKVRSFDRSANTVELDPSSGIAKKQF